MPNHSYYCRVSHWSSLAAILRVKHASHRPVTREDDGQFFIDEVEHVKAMTGA